MINELSVLRCLANNPDACAWFLLLILLHRARHCRNVLHSHFNTWKDLFWRIEADNIWHHLTRLNRTSFGWLHLKLPLCEVAAGRQSSTAPPLPKQCPVRSQRFPDTSLSAGNGTLCGNEHIQLFQSAFPKAHYQFSKCATGVKRVRKGGVSVPASCLIASWQQR